MKVSFIVSVLIFAIGMNAQAKMICTVESIGLFNYHLQMTSDHQSLRVDVISTVGQLLDYSDMRCALADPDTYVCHGLLMQDHYEMWFEIPLTTQQRGEGPIIITPMTMNATCVTI